MTGRIFQYLSTSLTLAVQTSCKKPYGVFVVPGGLPFHSFCLSRGCAQTAPPGLCRSQPPEIFPMTALGSPARVLAASRPIWTPPTKKPGAITALFPKTRCFFPKTDLTAVIGTVYYKIVFLAVLYFPPLQRVSICPPPPSAGLSSLAATSLS